MSLTCHPRNWEGRQEDHKFEDSLGYTISSMEGRKEGKKEGRKEGKMEGRKEEIVILG
jgi:predicted transposase YdaD